MAPGFTTFGNNGIGTFRLGDANGSGTFIKGSGDANFYIRNNENGDGTLEDSGEFRINATTEGNQIQSAVAMDSDGDLVVAWVGPDYNLGEPVVDPDDPVSPAEPTEPLEPAGPADWAFAAVGTSRAVDMTATGTVRSSEVKAGRRRMKETL